MPHSSVTVVHDGTPLGCSTSGGDVETTLDIEWSSTMAPEAAVKVFEGADPCDANFEAAIYDATHDASVGVISISWGECELDAGSSVLSTIDSYLAYGAATGKSIFVASGDSGSADCGGIGVDFPASSPNVTAVGGTSLTLNVPSQTWASETAWSGSGGGCSVEFSKPAGSPTIVADSGTVTVSWTGIPTATTLDWLALAKPWYTTGYDWWVYASSCTTSPGPVARSSGSCTVTLPSLVKDDYYEFRLFANNSGALRWATSGLIAIGSVPVTPTPTATP